MAAAQKCPQLLCGQCRRRPCRRAPGPGPALQTHTSLAERGASWASCQRAGCEPGGQWSGAKPPGCHRLARALRLCPAAGLRVCLACLEEGPSRARVRGAVAAFQGSQEPSPRGRGAMFLASRVLALNLQAAERNQAPLPAPGTEGPGLCPDRLPGHVAVSLESKENTRSGQRGGGWEGESVSEPSHPRESKPTDSPLIPMTVRSRASARAQAGWACGAPRTRGSAPGRCSPHTEGTEGGERQACGVAPGAPSLFLLLFQCVRQTCVAR